LAGGSETPPTRYPDESSVCVITSMRRNKKVLCQNRHEDEKVLKNSIYRNEIASNRF